MTKMKMEVDTKQRLLEKFVKEFHDAFKEEEIIDAGGNKKVQIVIDAEYVNQNLSLSVLSGEKEKYQINWPGKKLSIIAANSNINKTLRPVIDKSKDFAKTKNIYIEGDNLDALKLLRETYLEQIDLVYIDPPYNAGADILYKNNYEMSEEEFKQANYDLDEAGCIMTLNSESSGRFHTDWLNMMYSRIKVARDLLKQDGCIVIAIDHNELANLIKMCDEIFGEFNRLGIVTVVHKPEGRNMEKFFATSNEFALFYAKDKSKYEFQPAILDDEIKATYKYKDEKGFYKLNNYVRLGGGDHNLRINKPHFWYSIYVSEDLKDISFESKPGYTEVLPYSAAGQERTWKTKKETAIATLKRGELVAVKDPNGKIMICEKYREGQLIKTHWVNKKYNAINGGTRILEELMQCKTFDFPKSVYLMEDIIKVTSKKNGTILDFFSGSATTAHAVMNLNAEDEGTRNYILVQLPYPCDKNSEAYKSGYKTIPEIGEERIRRAGDKILKESKNKNIDVGFRVFRVDSSNMNDVYYNPKNVTQDLLENTIDNVKSDRSSLDLLFQCMLELNTKLSASVEEKTIEGKKCFIVENNAMIACFDSGLKEEVIKEIAKLKPVYAVFKDSAFNSDSSNINCEQIFKAISPSTIIKVL